jgi:hypothetical protein
MNKKIFILIILLPLIFRLYKITNPLVDEPNFRQAQTATVVKNYYINGLDLFRSELDIFGIGKEKYLTLEFPLYQSIVLFFYKTISPNDCWGRIVSILFSLIGGLYLFYLVKLINGNKLLALFSALFYFFVPLNLYHHRTFLIDTTVVTFNILGLYYFCLYINKIKKRYIITALILLSLGFMQKGMYGPFYLIPLVYLYFINQKKKQIPLINFIFYLFIPLAALFLWQQHVNDINILNGQEYFTTINKSHLIWNFGLPLDRLDWGLWKDRLSFILNGIFLKPGLIFFTLGLLILKKYKNYKFIYIFLISEILYFLIFFRIQSHNYYQMVMVPAFSIIMSAGLLSLSKYISIITKKILINIRINSKIKTIFVTILTILFSVYLLRSWMHVRWSYTIDTDWLNRMEKAGASIPLGSYGILLNYGYDWNSVYTYYTGRKMFLVDVNKLNLNLLLDLKNKGYSFVLIHDFHKYNYLLENKEFSKVYEYIVKNDLVYNSDDFIVYLFK